MPRDVEALKRLMSSDGDQVTAQLMMVDSAQDDGTVNVRMGETVFPGIACDSSYANRRPGDVVLVLKHAAGWRVLPPAGPAPAVANIDTTVTRWGQDPPSGSGWQQATQVWVRDGEVYAQLASAPSAPPSAPTNSPKETVGTTDAAMYSGGHRAKWVNSGNPVQGGYGGYANNTGAWFYGTRVTDACAGKTATGMRLRLVRRTSGGRSGGASPRLWLHNYATAPYGTPALTDYWGPDKTLGWGEGYTYDLPGGWVSKLASGAAKGIGCSAPNGNAYYILYTAGSGDLTITFD